MAHYMLLTRNSVTNIENKKNGKASMVCLSVFHQTGCINNTTNQQGQLDIHRIVHPTTAEFLFKHPWDIHKDIYILGHKTNVNKTVWSFLKELKTVAI